MTKPGTTKTGMIAGRFLVDPERCKHPPYRLYSWWANDCRIKGGIVLCVACCDCGNVLKGGV